MVTFITHLHAARAWLDAQFPGLSTALIGLTAVFAVWALKKWKPLWFAQLPTSVQALPAATWSALVASLSTVGPTIGAYLVHVLTTAALGGVVGVGVHHVLKEAPGPYGGPPKPKNKIPYITGSALVFLVACLGCSQFGVFSPAAKQDVHEACAVWEQQQAAVIADVGALGLPVAGLLDGFCDAYGVKEAQARLDLLHASATKLRAAKACQ